MDNQGLANDLSMRERLFNWLRGNTSVGQALAPTIERNPQQAILNEIQKVNIDRTRPPVNMPAPQRPNPYSVDQIIRDAQNSRPQYDAQGRPIRR